MEKITGELIPICSCGNKMILINYTGYYDEFNYWRCDDCNLDDKIQEMAPDSKERGSYA